MPASTTALVTGAGGFVGANLVRRLLADGHTVHALTRPGTRPWRLDDLSDVRRVQIDLADVEAVRLALQRARPEWVFHLAAHGAYSWQTDVQEIVRTNVAGTIALVDASVAAGCRVLVNAGSSSEYGYKDHAPSELELPEPNSAYAATKACATLYAAHAHRDAQTAVVTLRLYSVYGPWEEPGRLIPSLVAQALRGRLAPLADPATARDFVHVEDVVEAFLLAGGAASSAPSAIYTIGSGVQTSLAELVALVRRIFDLDIDPRWGSAAGRSWDTSVWVADPSRASRELGWSPRYDLESGIRGVADWLAHNPELLERYVAAVARRNG